MSEENPLKQVSDIYEFNETSDFMNDEEVDRALLKIVKILSNPDVAGVRVARHIVECQVLSAYFAIKARYYMGIGKTEPNAALKKNTYMTMKEAFHELAASLKYIQKAGD